MMILQDTIISFRGPELTFLFKIFPFFASETFYMGVIALGYWLATNASVFWKLGFLIPFFHGSKWNTKKYIFTRET